MTATESGYTHQVKTSLPPEYRRYNDGRAPGGPVATFLGLFSIGLGLAELLRPRDMQRLTGVRHPSLLQAYGVREIVSGLGILTSDRPGPWLWSRVAGDAIDLATLAAAYAEDDGQTDRARVLQSAAAVAGVTVLDVLCACEHTRTNH